MKGSARFSAGRQISGGTGGVAAGFAAAPPAQANWDSFSRSAKMAILYWVIQAKRPETRAARVAETARRAAVNEKANEPRSKD